MQRKIVCLGLSDALCASYHAPQAVYTHSAGKVSVSSGLLVATFRRPCFVSHLSEHPIKRWPHGKHPLLPSHLCKVPPPSSAQTEYCFLSSKWVVQLLYTVEEVRYMHTWSITQGHGGRPEGY